jgi:hypothetical protein
MANSKLQGQSFDIDKKIKNHLKKIFNAYKGAKDAEGYQRLEELVDKDSITYEQLKLIKNFFDGHNEGNKHTSYLLNGGTLMKNWIESTLNKARQSIKGKQDAMSDVGMKNQYQKEKIGGNVRIDTKKHDSDTNKILRQEGIYNMRLMENLITTIDKNRKLCLDNQ